jgi:hypothetical protein
MNARRSIAEPKIMNQSIETMQIPRLSCNPTTECGKETFAGQCPELYGAGTPVFLLRPPSDAQLVPVWNKGSIEQQGWQCGTHSAHIPEVASSSGSDANRYVIVRKFLQFMKIKWPYWRRTHDFLSARLSTRGIRTLKHVSVISLQRHLEP